MPGASADSELHVTGMLENISSLIGLIEIEPTSDNLSHFGTAWVGDAETLKDAFVRLARLDTPALPINFNASRLRPLQANFRTGTAVRACGAYAALGRLQGGPNVQADLAQLEAELAHNARTFKNRLAVLAAE